MIVCPCTYDYSGGRTNGSGNSRLKPAEKGLPFGNIQVFIAILAIPAILILYLQKETVLIISQYLI